MDARSNAGPPPGSMLISPAGENVLLLLGAPRSGTTWLAKMLDSHPDVIYRHEPDTVLRNDDIPYLCPREAVDEFRDPALRYLMRLLEVRTLKSAGSLPLFDKQFRGTTRGLLRDAIIYSLHAAGRVSRRSQWVRRAAIPDLIREHASAKPTIVLKSVSSRGRVRLYGEALPKSKIVFVLRHPCGQVASTLRGMKTGKFERRESLRSVLVLEEAKKFALSPTRFAALSPVQQCAWHWALLNQKALNDLGSLDSKRVMVLRYEDACSEPMLRAKDLLAFAGLAWSKQTAAYVEKSTSGGDNEEFYGTNRNPEIAAGKWRSSLTPAEQAQILEIAAGVPAGQMFVEMAA